MAIGRVDRWWNRRIPVRKILLAASLVVVVVFGYICFESMIESVVWSVTHRSVATYKGWPGTKYEGFSVKVPWMWRQEESLGSEHSVSLVRARFGTLVPLESVSITRDASVGDGLKLMDKTRENIERINLKPGIPKPRVVDFSVDADLAAHFKCSAMAISADLSFFIQCASKDGGRWSVHYQNFAERNSNGLNAVLRSLAAQQ